MKHCRLITPLLFLSLVLLFCTRQPAMYPAQEDFQDITALMTPQPDSALEILLKMYDTITAEDATVPYSVYMKYRLLLSEALFKNDYQQPDTFTINKIVNFYDSLGTVMPENKDLQFQRARAYYYQGVTRQEQDDIVGTCQAFLNSLEIMETNFAEKDMDYDKTRFMALIYSRLGALFYQEYAVAISKALYLKSYDYFQQNQDTLDILLSKRRIAKLYVDENKADSAIIYYNNILNELDSIKNLGAYLMYKGELSLIYFNEKQIDTALSLIKSVVNSMGKENIYLNGIYSNYGEMLYTKKEYKLAKYYLLKEDFEKANMFAKERTAELLSEIYKMENKTDSADYYTALAKPYVKRFENKAIDKNEIVELYRNYEENKALFKHKKHYQYYKTIITFSSFVVIIIIIIVVVFLYKKIWKKNQYVIQEKDTLIAAQKYSLKLSEIKFNRQPGKQSFEQKWKNFTKSEIYLKIKRSISIDGDKITIKTINNYSSLKLKKKDLFLLQKTIDTIFDNSITLLSKSNPKLNHTDLTCCCLLLMNFNIVEIAVLLGVKYNTAHSRIKRIKEILNIEEDIKAYLLKIF